MRPRSLTAFRVFEAVARLGSFSQAARELAVTQPAVSAQVRRLERDYGVALFERIRRRARLTHAGETLYRYVQRVFALLDEAGQTLEATRGLQRGRLTLAAGVTLAAYYVPPLVTDFKRRHPGVEVRVVVANSTRVLEHILALEADVGVLGGEPQHSQIVRHELWRDPLVIIAAPGHPLAKQRSVPLDALKGHAFILREPGSATRAFAEQLAARVGLPLTVGMEVGSNEAVKRIVQMGGGLSLVSRTIVEHEVRDGRLALLKLRGSELSGLRRRIDLVYHRDRAEAPLIQAVLRSAQARRRRGSARGGGSG